MDPAKHLFSEPRSFAVGTLATRWQVPFIFHPNSVIIRTDLLREIDGWPATISNEDLGMILRASEMSAGSMIPAVLTKYRVWEKQEVAHASYPQLKYLAFAYIESMINALRNQVGRPPIKAPLNLEHLDKNAQGVGSEGYFWNRKQELKDLRLLETGGGDNSRRSGSTRTPAAPCLALGGYPRRSSSLGLGATGTYSLQLEANPVGRSARHLSFAAIASTLETLLVDEAPTGFEKVKDEAGSFGRQENRQENMAPAGFPGLLTRSHRA